MYADLLQKKIAVLERALQGLLVEKIDFIGLSLPGLLSTYFVMKIRTPLLYRQKQVKIG